MHCFPRAVAYLDSGRIRVKGMVSTVPLRHLASASRILPFRSFFTLARRAFRLRHRHDLPRGACAEGFVLLPEVVDGN